MLYNFLWYKEQYRCLHLIHLFSARDCYLGSSQNYAGTASKTITGLTCQGWDDNNPWTEL